DERMDTPAPGRFDGLGAAVNIFERSARETTDDSFLRTLSDLTDGSKVTFRCDREASFDDVYAHIVEQLCNLELFLVRHGCTGTLLAVAQGGVENDDAVLLGLCLGSHESDPSLRVRRGGRSMGSPSDPPSAQAQMPSRPSGADKEKERAQNEGC